MAISSASTRIFKAEDPVMQTDLDLLAKVNEHNQEKFDEGEKNIQNEVNNWSMLANVAKPQDKDYINQKLNKLVSGINDLGGVNLADVNNVNAIKSMGYNMYGDDNVMNPVLTTRKMQALAQDIQTKTSGKNAKDYDSVNGEYLLSKYNEWLGDGQQGTKFDGPTSLPQGSFDGYNKKVQEALAKLQPDSTDVPVDDKDARFNYYQVGSKVLRKDKVEAAIAAITSAQDMDIMTAHAWKNMSHLPDQNILALQQQTYDASLTEAQSKSNYLTQQLSFATNDFEKTQRLTAEKKAVDQSIKNINGQKAQVAQLGQQPLSRDVREQLSTSLFFNAYKDDMATSRAFEQTKTELKTNQGAIAATKMDQQAYFFGQNYKLKEEELKLKKSDQNLKEEIALLKWGALYNKNNGLKGPTNDAPLTIVKTHGKDDTPLLDNTVAIQADANYITKANDFYSWGYDYLMATAPSTYGKYLQQTPEGKWVPKDTGKSTEITNSALTARVGMFDEISKLSIKEREGLKFGENDLELFKRSQELEQARLYKEQIRQTTNEVFRTAGKESPDTKTVTLNFNDGTKATVSYAKLWEMQNRKDPMLEEWKNKSKKTESTIYSPGGSMFAIPSASEVKSNSVEDAVAAASAYYSDDKVAKAWEDQSKAFNQYGQVATLPKQKNGQLANEQWAKVIYDALDDKTKSGTQMKDIDILKVWPKVDFRELDPNKKIKYLAEVRVQKGKGGEKQGEPVKGDKTTVVDLTDQVNSQYEAGGGWLSNLYGHDDADVVYGLRLSKQGRTPFDKATGYAGALQTHEGLLSHKYGVTVVGDPKSGGTKGYTITVAIPVGKDQSGKPQFQEMPVPNFLADPSGATTMFPPNFQGVRAYMETLFSNSDKVRDFYEKLGVPFNK